MIARNSIALTFATLCMPWVASAQVLGQFVGYLNILVGLLLVAAFLCFGSGLIVYVSRFGLVGRDLGIQQMSWGVTILFVITVMLWGVRFVQNNAKLAMTLIALVVFMYVGRIVFAAMSATSAEEEH